MCMQKLEPYRSELVVITDATKNGGVLTVKPLEVCGKQKRKSKTRLKL